MDDRTKDSLTCPNCGMPESEWTGPGGHGYTAGDGKQCCCQGCAEGEGCTCQKPAAGRNDPRTQRAADEISAEGISGKEELMGNDAGEPSKVQPQRGGQEIGSGQGPR